jgi:nucleotide-binding universal stress UspA family protein
MICNRARCRNEGYNQYRSDFVGFREVGVYKKIMIPIDLEHVEQLGKALETAADLANNYNIVACYVGVTAPSPSAIAANPKEFATKLEEFARRQSAAHGHATEARAYTSHDPASDLDDTLLKAVDDVGADLVVMASHIPNLIDYIWPSNGGKIASHAAASVFVVR